jgi:hypothetical protein
MMNYVYIILIIIFFIFFYIFKKEYDKNKNINKFVNKLFPESKSILWLYWEGVMPDYIKMCRETIYKHCSSSFEIIFLNNENINIYLPELNDKKLDFSKLKIAQKVDYYRIALLYNYGGLYMDMDIIVLKDLKDIIKKLDKYDFVGFGCTGYKCKYGYGNPSNWLLVSKPKTILMKNILNEYEKKLEEFNKTDNKNLKKNYFDFGKYIIWKELDILIKEGYEYYHYPNTVDGTRDKNGEWVTMSRLFSNKYIDYDKPNDLFMVVLYNSDLDDFDKTCRQKTKDELLKQDINFTKYYKKSMLIR